MAKVRHLREVPFVIVIALALSLGAQVFFHATNGRLQTHAVKLPQAPTLAFARTLSFGDSVALAKVGMLWLQSFDNQPGISLPFNALDYSRLINWLSLLLELDPNASYSLLAASRVYSEVPDPTKQALVLDFVYAAFLEAPNRRWQWLAHAVYVAKHRLDEPERALVYARALAAHATGANVPHWAQQMVVFVLEDMGEIEAAKILLGGLLASGEITDPHEHRFLSQRLQKLEDEP